MTINQLILRNLKKNLKHYYLYVFALIFAVALYFAFITLQYDSEMDSVRGTVKGEAGIKTASFLLIGIVTLFLLYANRIFIKRRSQEIGLFQLIGMRKGQIFRLLTLENLLIYYGSLGIGVFAGFSISKLVTLILFRITGVEAVSTLNFSTQALTQTLLVFTSVFILIALSNFIFIKRQSILSLFQVKSTTQGKTRRRSVTEMLFGVLGIGLITIGYYVSSKLFDGDFVTPNTLFGAMGFILLAVILGTYLFYKGSVSFIGNLLRKRKNGYMTINEVLSLSSVLFRMKSNALLLTIITTVSALAIGLLSLSYIAYYSAEQTAAQSVAGDFSFTNEDTADQFTEKLEANNIAYDKHVVDVLQFNADVEDLVGGDIEAAPFDYTEMRAPVVSDADIPGIDIGKEEILFSGFNDLVRQILAFKDTGTVILQGLQEDISLEFIGLRDAYLVNMFFTSGGLPTMVVDEETFERLKEINDPNLQYEFTKHIAINLEKDSLLKKADSLFQQLEAGDSPSSSKYAIATDQKRSTGLTMFIVGFLGLTFLVTSGCVLYFKQMDEGEEEKPNYTILRKLGFTRTDLLRGIQGKQLFNFGIPLVVGLLHSYFAVQSGWFIFGTEVWTPMIIVMVLYTVLYSLFGLLSVFYYRKLIRDAL